MESVYDLVIIGAGPAGLEAALQAKAAGLSYLLLDQDDAGSLIERTMAEKKFLHVYGRNTATLKGLLPFPDRLKGGELVALWKIAAKDLAFRSKTKVVTVKRSGDLFEIKTDKDTLPAKSVILSSGTFEKHRTLGIPGEDDNEKVFYTMDYYQEYDDQTVLVVGGGNSALESAIHLAPYNSVTLLVRKSQFARNVAENNLTAIRELEAAGKVRILWNSTVVEIGQTTAVIERNGVRETLPYTMLYVHAGFVQPSEFLASMGIAIENEKAVFDPATFETNVPGLFIAGALTGADSVIESANQSVEIVRRLT